MLRIVNPIILGVIRRSKAVYFIIISRTCAALHKLLASLAAARRDRAQTLAKLGAQKGAGLRHSTHKHYIPNVNLAERARPLYVPRRRKLRNSSGDLAPKHFFLIETTDISNERATGERIRKTQVPTGLRPV